MPSCGSPAPPRKKQALSHKKKTDDTAFKKKKGQQANRRKSHIFKNYIKCQFWLQWEWIPTLLVQSLTQKEQCMCAHICGHTYEIFPGAPIIHVATHQQCLRSQGGQQLMACAIRQKARPERPDLAHLSEPRLWLVAAFGFGKLPCCHQGQGQLVELELNQNMPILWPILDVAHISSVSISSVTGGHIDKTKVAYVDGVSANIPFNMQAEVDSLQPEAASWVWFRYSVGIMVTFLPTYYRFCGRKNPIVAVNMTHYEFGLGQILFVYIGIGKQDSNHECCSLRPGQFLLQYGWWRLHHHSLFYFELPQQAHRHGPI